MSAANNSKKNRSGLENAEEIIERFGGIRPMASKMDVPVTTVQGWKKRNVIPGNRIDDVLEAAQDNNVDLSGILIKGVANQNDVKEKSFQNEVKAASESQNKTDIEKHEKAIETARSQDDMVKKDSEIVETTTETAIKNSKSKETVSERHDALIKEIRIAEKMAVRKSVWVSTALVVLALAGVAVLLMPGQRKVAELDVKTQKLGMDVEEIKKGGVALFKGLIPEGLEANIKELQDQAKMAQATVHGLSEQVDGLAADAKRGDIGALAGRVKNIETHIMEMTGVSPELVGFMDKIGSLQNSMEGQEQLSKSLADLFGVVMGMQGQEMAAEGADAESSKETMLTEALQNAQAEDDSLGQTLEGVTPTDLKAAAMLLTLSKLRSSLRRSEPFEEDLALMQAMLGGPEKHPGLYESMNKLAPKAKDGVLTPDGLKGEFKGLAGDIVVSSLKGEEVSVQEKAKARLNEILSVEKDGELITGTDTQATVARAQKMLDEGDIEGAVAELKTLDGEAAETAQPFIDDAMMTMLAQQFRIDITGTVMDDVGIPDLPSLSGKELDLKSIATALKGKVVGGTIVKDEASGFSILVPGKKFPELPRQ